MCQFLGHPVCYRSVVCLTSCLSVCYVGVLCPNSWMDQNETWHGDRSRPHHIVFDGDPAPPLPKKGTAPNFRPISVVAKRLVGSRCHLMVRRYRPRHRRHLYVLDVTHLSPKGGGISPHFSAHVLWPDGWMDQDGTWYECRRRPRRHCVR